MLDFDLNLKPATIAVKDVAPIVKETVTVMPVKTQGASYVMKDEQAWGWSDLRDYVMREIEKRHGPQVRDPKREAGIFKSFMSRWPEQSVEIAKTAFGPVYDGMWHNAPISINRFCKASDGYFAQVIASKF
jgi:hypothetical protein